VCSRIVSDVCGIKIQGRLHAIWQPFILEETIPVLGISSFLRVRLP
jgi:hypothetical protein